MVSEGETPLRLVTILSPHTSHVVTVGKDTWTISYESGLRTIAFNLENPCAAFTSCTARVEEEVLQP